MFYLRNSIKLFFDSKSDEELFHTFMSLQGERFRHQEGRLTQRVILNDQTFFIKQHTGVGWKEIIKNLLQLKLPVTSAKNEFRAIQKLKRLNLFVPDIAGYGCKGLNPAKCKSFILMDALTPTISLEDFCKHWQNTPPLFTLKRKLIDEVALIARTMHENGINHRDFYLCHFLLDLTKHDQQQKPRLYLIDLHRAQLRRLTPKRSIIKDLTGLYFSSKDIGLTKRDMFRFMKAYKSKTLREILSTERNCWEKVKKRGEKLYRDHAKG